MKFIATWLSNIVALYVAATLIPGVSYDGAFLTLAIAALVFGLLNLFIRPILIFLTLPAVIVTLGFFILLINALMLYFTSRLVHEYHIGGFWSAIGAVIVISLTNWVIQSLLKSGGDDAAPRRRARRLPE
jgi:putative membrane protein